VPAQSLNSTYFRRRKLHLTLSVCRNFFPSCKGTRTSSTSHKSGCTMLNLCPSVPMSTLILEEKLDEVLVIFEYPLHFLKDGPFKLRMASASCMRYISLSPYLRHPASPLSKTTTMIHAEMAFLCSFLKGFIQNTFRLLSSYCSSQWNLMSVTAQLCQRTPGTN